MTRDHEDHDKGNGNVCTGLIYAKTPKAAFKIVNLLHKQNVADLFPGNIRP